MVCLLTHFHNASSAATTTSRFRWVYNVRVSHTASVGSRHPSKPNCHRTSRDAPKPLEESFFFFFWLMIVFQCLLLLFFGGCCLKHRFGSLRGLLLLWVGCTWSSWACQQKSSMPRWLSDRVWLGCRGWQQFHFWRSSLITAINSHLNFLYLKSVKSTPFL